MPETSYSITRNPGSMAAAVMLAIDTVAADGFRQPIIIDHPDHGKLHVTVVPKSALGELFVAPWVL